MSKGIIIHLFVVGLFVISLSIYSNVWFHMIVTTMYSFYLNYMRTLEYRINNWLISRPTKITKNTQQLEFSGFPRDIVSKILYHYALNGPKETIDVWSTCKYVHNNPAIKHLYSICRGWYRARFVVNCMNVKATLFGCMDHTNPYNFGCEIAPGVLLHDYDDFDSEKYPGVLSMKNSVSKSECINMCVSDVYLIPCGSHDQFHFNSFVRLDYSNGTECTMLLWSCCMDKKYENFLKSKVEFI